MLGVSTTTSSGATIGPETPDGLAAGASEGEESMSAEGAVARTAASAEDDAARIAISAGSNGTISGRGTTWDALPAIPPCGAC